MYKRILIPLDLTDRHAEALRHAGEVAAGPQREIVLLHVIETIPGLGPAEEKPFYDRLERVARKHLEKHAASLAARKVPCQIEVRLGNRAREIARFAKESGADLIVLTAPMLDPENPAQGWGSMSWRVTLLSPCPVLLAKG
jgi:nucleotide-binding universal stress UspA family protein